MRKTTDGLQDVVRQKYAEIAVGKTQGCCGGTACCGSALNVEKLVQNIGYDATSLEMLPDGANMGLSCGNPLALASLQAGEIVADLGCGGGFDVFQAAPRVGQTGRVIGVDMTEEMLAKARAALPWYHSHSGLENVEFRQGTIEALPIEDSTVDVVLSNCVINLSADKTQAWKEIFRVLRPGGRFSVSDIALLRPLPESIEKSVAALVGCVAGAILLEETQSIIKQLGFDNIEIQKKTNYVISLQNDPLYMEIAAALPQNMGLHEFIVSVSIAAKKP